MEDTKQIFCAKIWLRGVGSESKCWDWEITCARNAIEMAIKWWRCKKREWGWEGGKLWPPNMFAGEPRKLNSTLQRNTFYSVGQNPCLTYWEIGGNVCPVNIGDVEAAGGYKKGWLNCQTRTSFKTIKVAWFGRYWYFFCLNDQASTAWIHFLRDLLTDDDQFGRMCSEPVTICRKELWGRSFGVQDCSYLPVIFFSEEFQMEKLMMDCEDEDPRKSRKIPSKATLPFSPDLCLLESIEEEGR